MPGIVYVGFVDADLLSMTLIGFGTDDAPRNVFPPVKPKAGGWCPAEAGVQPGWRVLGVSEGRHAPLFPVRLPQRQQLRSRFHGRARPAPSSLQRASRGLWRLCSLQRRSRERLGLRLFLRCRLSSSSSPRTGKRPDRSGEAAAEVSAVNGGWLHGLQHFVGRVLSLETCQEPGEEWTDDETL